MIDKSKKKANILFVSRKIEYDKVSETLKAIAHPVRLQIAAGLLKDECNVGRIQERLGLPQSTISQHLSILRRYGIVKARREGVKVCYKVTEPMVRRLLLEMLAGEPE